MSPLPDATETDHKLIFKALIDNFRKIASVAFGSVCEKTLSEPMDDCKVKSVLSVMLSKLLLLGTIHPMITGEKKNKNWKPGIIPKK